MERGDRQRKSTISNITAGCDGCEYRAGSVLVGSIRLNTLLPSTSIRPIVPCSRWELRLLDHLKHPCELLGIQGESVAVLTGNIRENENLG